MLDFPPRFVLLQMILLFMCVTLFLLGPRIGEFFSAGTKFEAGDIPYKLGTRGRLVDCSAFCIALNNVGQQQGKFNNVVIINTYGSTYVTM